MPKDYFSSWFNSDITTDSDAEIRLKTASMPAINSAAINSKLYSFSSPFLITAGGSEIYNISVAGLSLFYSLEASGLDIVVYNQAATGTFGATDAAHNMNFATGNGITYNIVRTHKAR